MARQSDIRIRRSAVSGAIPSTANLNLGELALNTYDGKLYMKKDVAGTETVVEIGGGTTQDGVWQEYVYTATSNQTTFSGSDDNSQTLSYLRNYIQVFLNGILLDNGTDYTATSTTSIILVNGASSGDLLQISSFVKVLGSGDIAVDTFTPNGSTAVFTLSTIPNSEENLTIFIDGVYQEQSTYSVSSNTLTLDANPASGTTVEVIIGTNNVTTSNIADLVITGDLTVGGTGTFSGAITGNLTGNVSGSAAEVTSLSNHNTGALAEGTNLYFTDERVDDRVGALIVGGTGITATYNDAAGTLTLDGSAQYGDSDVESYLSGGTGVTFSSGVISIGQAVATTDNVTFGVITATGGTSTNWNTAYGWGNHASVGYTTTDTTYSAGTGVTLTGTTFSLTDTAAKWTQDNTKISNWDTAYGWGDHSTESYATQTYVGTQISNLVDSSPTTLDTLNELAAALGDDPNFATTVTTSIGTKWTQDNTKISNWDTAFGWGNHATAGYAASSHVHSYLPLAGGTLSGSLSLGTNDITSVGTITATQFSGGLLGDVTGNVLGNVTGDVSGSSGTVASLGGHTTADLTEGTNLYYTDARADARIAAATTADLTEGTNLYYTDARADARIAAATTADLTEGTNLYFTDERVDDRVAALVVAGTNITTVYDDTAGTLTINSSGKTQEEIEDIVGGLLVAGTNITTTYNDAAGTLTINSSGKTQEEIEDIVDGLLTAGAGIGLTYDDGAGTLTVTNTQLGANAFGNIIVSGQTTVAADSTNDTLTLVGQNGVTITTDAGSDTVTIDGHTSYAPFNTDLFTANGTDTTFVLSSTPSSADNLIVFVEGVYQNKNSFSLSGSTLTLSPAIPNTQEIVVHQIGDVVSGVGLLRNNFTGDGTTTAFTLTQDPLHEDNLFIYSDGVYQEKGEFSVSGTTLTFGTAPASGDSIEVIVPKMTEIQTPSVNAINDATQFNTNNIIPNVVTTTVVASTSATTIASHSATIYRTVKYLVQCTQGTAYHSTELNLIHDGTNVYITEYGSLWDSAALGTFDATISGGNILLQITAGSASSMTTKVISTAVPV